MPTDCPSCDDKFDSETGMVIHHKLSHGKSLVEKTSICSIDDCTNEFSYYPSEKEGTICPECIKDGKNVYHAGTLKKKDIYKPNVNVEYEDVVCYSCGEEDSVMPSRVSGDVYTCSRKCLDEYNSQRMKGENNPRYKDGGSRGSTYDRVWRSVKRKAIDRDGGTCCICDSDESLHVHHLKPVRTFENSENAHFLSNAITLCDKCHPKVEHGKIEISDSLIDSKGLVEPEIIF
jgi:hypothetical protein